MVAEPTAIGTAVPLLLNFREVLLGNGFVVEVQADNGRALCVREEDGFWIYGVNPGGMAAHGDDAVSARLAFRTAFSEIMIEIAGECHSFDAFSSAVRGFFADTNRPHEATWREAVQAVRCGLVSDQELKRSSADAPLNVRVSIKSQDDVRPTDNQPNLQLQLAA